MAGVVLQTVTWTPGKDHCMDNGGRQMTGEVEQTVTWTLV